MIKLPTYKKIKAFWKNAEIPSLKKFLDFRLCVGDLNDEQTEHRRYKAELNTISQYYDESSDIGQKLMKWKKSFKEKQRTTCSVINYLVNLRLGNGKNCVSVDEHVMTGMSVCSAVFQWTTLPTASWQRGKLHVCLLFQADNKKSKQVELFWGLQMKWEMLHIESKILEEEKELQEKLCLKEEISRAFKSKQPAIGWKQCYEEELPSTPTSQ
ncbi:9180_t:CDS:2, partial [Paraglomus brasilianum]